MAKSKIEWTERVWNPLTGCTRIGQGCVHCYAERMAARLAAMGKVDYQDVVNEKGHWNGQVKLLFDKLHEPMRWKKPSRVFVNSMSDLFHEKVPQIFINQVVRAMSNAHWHTFQVLTKRYDRPFLALYPQDAVDHIWIGFSICTQQDADKAREYLRMVSRDGWRTWISYEPSLEKIDWKGFEFVEWFVCGGESGPEARPMHPDWARSARDWCRENSIPYFFKQWGEWAPLDHLPWVTDATTFKHKPIELDGTVLCHVGKGKAGRVLDGVELMEYPPEKRAR